MDEIEGPGLYLCYTSWLTTLSICVAVSSSSSAEKTPTKRKKNTKKITRELPIGKHGARLKKKLKKLVAVTVGESSTNQTTNGQQSGQETTKNQSPTSARGPSRCQNGEGTIIRGCGTGGEEPPGDDRPRKKSPPQDAPGNKKQKEDESSEDSTKNISLNGDKQPIEKFFRDEQRVTGYFLGAGDNVAGDQQAATVSPGRESLGLRDGGSFSSLQSHKPVSQPTPAEPMPQNARRFNASPSGLVNQDGSQHGNRSPSTTIHTIFGDYRPSFPGGEQPPDDDGPREKSPPQDAPGNKKQKEDESSEDSTKNISLNGDKQPIEKFLRDEQRVTGYFLGAGDDVAGDQQAATVSSGRESLGLRDGGSFSSLQSHKPGSQPNPAQPVPQIACRFTASPCQGLVNQDGSQHGNISPSTTIHTIFGDYKPSEIYQRPPDSYPPARSWSPPRFLSGTPIYGEFEEHLNPRKEVPTKEAVLSNRDINTSSVTSQPEPLKDASALIDTSSQTQLEEHQGVLVKEYRQRNVPESSGQGSWQSQVERELIAFMRENFLNAAHSQEDPKRMQELMIDAISLPDINNSREDEN